MKISVFGLGYVGCVSLGCLADLNHQVIGVDTLAVKVDLINSGKPTIVEKDIDILIAKYHSIGTITATMDVSYAISKSEISIICVGTPSLEDGSLNLQYLYNCSKEIGLALKKKNGFHTIVIRSTVMPGTNLKVGELIALLSGKTLNKDFGIVSNPEFLREGSAVKDYFNPPVTVLGSECPTALAIMKDVYKEIPAEIVETNVSVAEIIKYVNNSYHALKVAFANEVGNLCKNMGIDSHKVMELFCKDKQLNISEYYFKPGFAYGGSCLPKDLGAIISLSKDYGLETYILSSINISNEYQKRLVFGMIKKTKKNKIGIIGISFKQGTDDLRYSPMVCILSWLIQDNYNIVIYDENVRLSLLIGANKDYINEIMPDLDKMLLSSIEEIFLQSEVIIISQKNEKITHLINEYPDKIIIDLIRIDNRTSKDNYIGICW